MRRRIFLFSAVLAGLAVLVTAILITLATHQDFFAAIKEETRAQSACIQTGFEMDGVQYLRRLPELEGHRITLIGPDGSVLFDSKGNPNRMGNHLDRPEVQAALLIGVGESTRFSDTVREQTYYYAVSLEGGEILRVSNTTASAVSSFDRLFWLVALIVISVFLISAVIASRITKGIVRPINEINLDIPEYNAVYDEIAPLLIRIKEQNSQIRQQMSILARERREFSSITEQMSEGLLVLDRDAKVLSHNKSALKLLAANTTDVDGRNILSLNRSEALRIIIQNARRGESVECVTQLGGRHCQILASPVMEDGSLQGVILLLMDVTEQQERERLRREFTANVSHELKTPLTSISGYAEIMMNGMTRAEDLPEFSGRIYQEAQRLIALVKDLMFLSGLEENTPPPKEEVGLLALSHTIAARLKAKAAEKQVSLSVSGDPGEILGIPFLLDEMVCNLLDNAIKYNREGGSASITITQGDDRVVLAVSDTGTGVPPADQGRIFERFYRADKSHNERIEGTGLGLAIVKHGAKLHHAQLLLESSEHGSCFSLSFPYPPGADNLRVQSER